MTTQKPRFNLIDKVVILDTDDNRKCGMQAIVLDITTNEESETIYVLSNGLKVRESEIDYPRITHSTTNKPNLCRFLADFSQPMKNLFYLVGGGDVSFIRVNTFNVDILGRVAIEVDTWSGAHVWLNYDGSLMNGDGSVMLFPSKEYYIKYAFNPLQAWIEWYDDTLPDMWKPKVGDLYWYFDRRLEPQRFCAKSDAVRTDMLSQFDITNIMSGNCFQTEEECLAVINGVKTIVKNHHINKRSERTA